MLLYLMVIDISKAIKSPVEEINTLTTTEAQTIGNSHNTIKVCCKAGIQILLFVNELIKVIYDFNKMMVTLGDIREIRIPFVEVMYERELQISQQWQKSGS